MYHFRNLWYVALMVVPLPFKFTLKLCCHYCGQETDKYEVRFNKSDIKFFVGFMEIFRPVQKFDVMIDIHTYIQNESASLPKEGKRARTKLRISSCNSDHVAHTVLRGSLRLLSWPPNLFSQPDRKAQIKDTLKRAPVTKASQRSPDSV